jgi:DNA-binding NarL/FixJ family response regulator
MIHVPSLRVICMDDNPAIGDAVKAAIRNDRDMVWGGWFDQPGPLLAQLSSGELSILILDIDLPGADAFEILSQVQRPEFSCRVIMLSGHVRPDLVDRAFAGGAWGYVSKNEEHAEFLRAIRMVRSDSIAVSPEAAAVYRRL